MISFRTNERGSVSRAPVLTDAEIAALMNTGTRRRKTNVAWKAPVPSRQAEIDLDPVTVRRIVMAVATAFGQTPESIASDSNGVRPRRPRHQSIPRHVAIYLLRLAGASYNRAAAALKLADHSAAVYAERRMVERLGEDHALAFRVRKIMDTLGLA